MYLPGSESGVIDYSVYVITDSKLSRGRGHLEVVEKALAGGATCIQLREKELSSRELFNLAQELLRVTASKRVPLIVNDRLDVALAVGADGVHLGQDDLPPLAARRIMPPEMILGVSVDNAGQAVEAQRLGASYLGAGAVFATGSKPDAGEPMGLETLASICRSVNIPVVGIGGIDAQNVGKVIKAGAAGAAVISAVVAAEDIAAAAAELKREVQKALRARQKQG